jgi:predicted alpha/beta superfamily hydrolase
MLTLDLYTPEDDLRPVFLTGTFNGWATRDERFKMNRVRDGYYQFSFGSLPDQDLSFEYKYVKGGWESEELGSDGAPPPNRKMLLPKGRVNDIVPRWKKHDNWYDPAFYPDIQIVSKRFSLPQLSRRRRISVLLPWDYHNSEKRYPVLYLQDGQNLFEPDAPYGTWGVDKQLAYLSQQGKGDFIVVAIDHGGRERIKEFSPYDSAKWGEGLGREYAGFLAETLKPYIDKTYRTAAGRQYTGIGGSSMGGLISIYAGLMYPQVFSRFMIFSPSLWISPRIFFEPVRFSSLDQTRIYLYAGGREGANMTDNSARFIDMLRKRGYDASKLQLQLEIDPDGKHNEARWGREFPKAANWLFE